MPLRDHFDDNDIEKLPWDTLLSSWASDIGRSLNLRWLKRLFRALEHRHVGPRVEIDGATFEKTDPPAVASEPLLFPDTFEVRVFSGPAGWDLVAAIELISPSNKDRPAECEAFVRKCASYLNTGVSVVLIDVVTGRNTNLHHELLDLLGITGPARFTEDVNLYAAAYRPVQPGDLSQVDIWREPCRIGEPLPTMPLRLTGDLFVPVEFEATYMETCRCHDP